MNLPSLDGRPRAACPKPTPRRILKGRKQRAEDKQKRIVRAACVARDGFCRLMGCGPCAGVSEWAHLGAKKRARTRGMAPEARHTTGGSLMVCTGHHAAYDAGKIRIEAETDRGADGPLRVSYPLQGRVERAVAC